MTSDFIVILLLGALTSGFVNGLAGFGTSLFALGWWLQVMSPRQAVALVLVMSVASGLQGVWEVRRSIAYRRLGRFLLPALGGIPLGALILDIVDAAALKLLVALFLLGFGFLSLTQRRLPQIDRPAPIADVVVGFVGGVLGSAAGLSGPLPTMWLALRNWSKSCTRAVLQPYNVVVLAIAAVVLAASGAYDRAVLLSIVIALPATMIAARAGLAVFRHLDDRQFRTLLVVLLFASGLVMIAREALRAG